MGVPKSISQKRTRPRMNGWVWSGIILILVVGSGAAWYSLGGSANLFQSGAAAATPDFHTAVVRRGNISLSASGTGTLIASQSVDLSFSSKGVAAQVNVKAGDTVKAGQVLASLGSSQNLEAAVAADQLAVLQAQKALDDLTGNANVALAQAYQTMLKAQQDYTDALATDQRASSARCSQATVIKDKGALDLAASHLEEISQRYYGSDAWINAKNVYDQALANYTYCAAYTPVEKTDASASVQVSLGAYQQAQTTYNTLKNGSGVDPSALAIDQAKLTQAQTQLAQDQEALKGITLIAPMDGTVTYLAASAGALVDSSSKFISLANLSQPAVSVSVDETDLDKLTVGAAAQVTFDALPDQVFNGKVTQVNPQLTTSGQYKVATGTVLLDEQAGQALQKLPLGLSASVTVIQKQATNVLIVPVSALRSLGGGQYSVFVMGSGGKLQLRVVQVGLQDSAEAEITNGLKEGDVVSTGATQTR